MAKRGAYTLFACSGAAYSRRNKRPCPNDIWSSQIARKQEKIQWLGSAFFVCEPCKRGYLHAKKASNRALETAIALIHAGRLINGLRDVNRIIAKVLCENERII